MSIVAECPHCETRFTLQASLVGKSMRCPNLDCREIFEVRPKFPEAPPPPPPKPEEPNDLVLSLDPDAPPTAVGAVEDMLPVVDAVLVPPPVPPKPSPGGTPRPGRTPRPRPKPGPKDREVEPEVVDAVVVAPPVREVVWSADQNAPVSPPERRDRVKAEPVEDEEPILRRRKRTNRGPLVLAILGIITVLAGGFGILYIVQFQQKTEERLAEQSKALYDDAQWAAAAKSYEQLAADYPDSARAEEYRFFADLASMQAAVRSVTNIEEPRPALAKFQAFAESRRDSRFAKPDAYGHDIVDAGKKLGEDLESYADGRVKAFAADRSKLDELVRAEEMIAAGRSLPALLEPFRVKDETPLQEVLAKLDVIETGVRGERRRLDVLARVRAKLAEPSSLAIEEASDELRRAGYLDDPEARGLIQEAESNLLARVRFEPDPVGPQAPAPASIASLVFVTPIGETKAADRGQLDEAPVIFLAVARGVLYALDEDNGNLIWALRLGPDVYDPPPVARVTFPEGPMDLAVVASNITGTSTVSGIEIGTGRVRWQQRLDAAPVGPAAIAGSRAFLPLRDPLGTVSVIDLASGTRLGRIVVGQPVSHVSVQPGTGHLYLAAESRRVFVFDTASEAGGARPRCLRVISTDHPAGTLRAPPLILGPAGEEAATRLLVLCQADGPTAMKLRAFPLPATTPPLPDAPPAIELISSIHEFTVPGWTRFPIASDGERLVLVTDAGQFRLFGINQRGNKDEPLFTVPHPNLPQPADQRPTPGLVVPAEESAYWVLAGGKLQKFRRTILPDRGLSVVPVDKTTSRIGEPTQPAQLNATRDTAFLVVRSPDSAGCRALAFSIRDGQVRWERQLGMMPASSPVVSGSGLAVVDAGGCAVTVPLADLANLQGEALASPDWVIAEPADAATQLTAVARSADGKILFTLTPVAAEGKPRWVIRRFEEGRLGQSGSVAAPALPAGLPAVIDGQLLVPAADGLIYRVIPGDRARPDSLARGPQWADRRIREPRGHVIAISNEEFITSDGGRMLTRWVWPKDGNWSNAGDRWEVREPISAPPIYLAAAAGRPARLLVADATGAVWLFDGGRGGLPVRQWVPGRTVSIPAGKVSDLGIRTDASGNRVAVYAVDGHRVVCLDLDRSDPKWVVVAGDEAGRMVVGAPQPIGPNWLVTDLTGRVAILDGETGQTTAQQDLALPGVVPAAAAVAIDAARVVVPLSDGSLAALAFAAPAPTPEPKARP